jgi:hypothetical protein
MLHGHSQTVGASREMQRRLGCGNNGSLMKVQWQRTLWARLGDRSRFIALVRPTKSC